MTRPCTLVLTALLLGLGCQPVGDDDDDSVADCTADERPTLSIGSPDTGEVFDGDGTISFAITVTDPDGDAAALDIAVQDNSDSQGVDLEIDVPPPNAQGQTSFTMGADLLDDGLNTVRIVVSDADGCSANDQVLVCVDYDQPPCQP